MKTKNRLKKFDLPDYDDCKVFEKAKGVVLSISCYHFYGHLIHCQSEDGDLFNIEELPDWTDDEDKDGNDLYVQTLRDTEWHLN